MDVYYELAYAAERKASMLVSGDAFEYRRSEETGSISAVLSDGLGSGVKANVLAIMSSVMLLKYALANIDIRKASSLVMATLPKCSVRKISYATFTVLMLERGGLVKIVEYGNPSYLLMRNGESFGVERKKYSMDLENRKEDAFYSEFKMRKEDRLLIFSDGVSQSGIGSASLPFGWGVENTSNFVSTLLRHNPQISAKTLSKKIVIKASANDGYSPADDITCACLYARVPRRLIVATGPPLTKEKDGEFTSEFWRFDGDKVICGGSTSHLISRESGVDIEVSLDEGYKPSEVMKGVKAVTEGVITLNKTLSLLENGNISGDGVENVLAEIFTENDSITFLTGTKLNEAHYRPKIPVELAVRINLVRKIKDVLERRYLKKVDIVYY